MAGAGLLFTPMHAIADAQSDEWNFTLTPYIWAAGIDGSIDAGRSSPGEAEFDSDYEFFLLDNLEAAAFLTFEANKGRWSILGDAAYIDFSDDGEVGPLDADLEFSGLIAEGAVGYQLENYPTVDVIGGIRYFDIETGVELGPLKATSEKDWTDPFIGIRYQDAISDNWDVEARGDIGGFGISAEMMYNAAVNFKYNSSENVSWNLGYRYLAADYDKGRFKFDVSLSGITAGVSIGF